MTEDELRALTDAEMRQSIGYFGGKLAEQRRKAQYYYLGLAEGELAPTDIEGRSQVVSPDVRNTIESMLPQLMAKFTGGDTVVEFEPTQQQDEQAASNCTDYLNYLFFKKNNGHSVTYTWFKDALSLKRGFLKIWWDTRNEETREEYRGQTPAGLAMLQQDQELEITEQRSYPDEDDAQQRQQALQQLEQQLQQAQQAAQQGNPQAQQAVQAIQARVQQINALPPAMLFDVTCKRSKKGGRICVENVPPEEFLISRRAKTIADSPFVAHRVQRTLSELKSMGYDNVDRLTSDDAAAALNMERVERISWDDELAYLDDAGGSDLDEAQRVLWVTECYIRCDFDGDGISELRKVVRAGNEILENEVVDAAPFVSICPIPLPHRFFGLSIADVGFETQRTKTAVIRAVLDNLYLEVNGRYFAVNGQVNIDDLLTSRPGGVVRVDHPGAVGRLDQGKGNLGEAMQMLEFLHQFGEDAMGWSRNSSGTDAQALGQTATATQIVTNKADMRLDLIARNFAEGFVDLFRMMLKLVSQYQSKTAAVRLSGKWVEMDPREWRNQFDVSINVGLGMGNKDQQVAHLMTLIQSQAGPAAAMGIVTPENIYESHVELAKNMGFKSGSKFFTEPQPGAQLPNPMAGEMQKAQLQAQNDFQIAQMREQFQASSDAADRQHQAQVEELKAKYQAMVDSNRQMSEAQQHQMKIDNEAKLAALEAHYKDVSDQREGALQERIAVIKGRAQIISARIASKEDESDIELSGENELMGQTPSKGDLIIQGQAQMGEHLAGLAGAVHGMAQALNRPKTIVRDGSGRAVGVQ